MLNSSKIMIFFRFHFYFPKLDISSKGKSKTNKIKKPIFIIINIYLLCFLQNTIYMLFFDDKKKFNLLLLSLHCKKINCV